MKDTGAGIAPQLLPRVFDLFVQGDRTPEPSQGGLGIGLTLVKRLVTMHGGTVRADSEGPGRGSEFTVTLPLVAALEGSQLQPAPETAAARSSHRILVVDDNVDACESIALILETFGYATRCLYDGPSVLPAAQQWQPDAIVLDIGLPGMSGLEVAAQLRREAAFARTPLLALSGYGQQEDRQRSHAAGFDLHLTKPVEPRRLLDALADVLAQQAA